LIPNPIQKVLSTLSTRQVRYLLMGGQACVLYGAAEFSRDLDLAFLPHLDLSFLSWPGVAVGRRRSDYGWAHGETK